MNTNQSSLGQSVEHNDDRRNILYTPLDRTFLSEPLCLMRAQIEAFAANPEDVAVLLKKAGKKISIGRVGIRCIHCSHLPPHQRSKGAVSYPNSTGLLHQAVRNFQRYHFEACDQTHADIKEHFRFLQGRGNISKKDSANYWIKCCERMGMVDTTADGIRFQAENYTDNAITNDYDSVVGTTTVPERKGGEASQVQSSRLPAVGGSIASEQASEIGLGREGTRKAGGSACTDDEISCCGGQQDEEICEVSNEKGVVNTKDWERPFRDFNFARHNDSSLGTSSGEPSKYPGPFQQHRDSTACTLLGVDMTTDTGNMPMQQKGRGLDKEAEYVGEAWRPPTDDDVCHDFVRFVDIGPHDVLFGRGPKVYNNIGNVAFRRLAATRKAEYCNSDTSKEKTRIAKEIVSHIRCSVDPPGRFLTMMDKSLAEAMGFPADADMWHLVDDETVLEKTKQTLRQQHRKDDNEKRKRTARNRSKPSACQELRENKEHGVGHAAQASGISSCTNVDEMSISKLKGYMPSVDGSEAFAEEGNDTSLGMDYMIGVSEAARATDGGLGFATVAGETISQAQWGYTNVHVTMPSGRPICGDGGIKVSGADQTQLTVPNIESVSDETALDERESLLESVRIALKLVKNVQAAHDAECVAYESNIGADGSNLSGERIRRDLVSLGFDLYRTFAGDEAFDESKDSTRGVEEAIAALKDLSIIEAKKRNKKERRPTTRKYALLRDLGFPVSLCILVSSLLDAEDEGAADRYDMADEVEEDLSLMMADPERYLFDAGADRQKGKLVFPKGRLYGREHDIASMVQVLNRVGVSTNGPREMMLISGYSGTGKSALVEHLRGPLLQNNGYFVSGKFDQLGQAAPTSVIFDAFNDYCGVIAKGSNDRLIQLRRAIQEALGSNGNVLTGLIPNLGKVIGVPAEEAVQVGGRETLNRFVFYFHLFVQAISSPSHPMILFLDDLQWADKASLNLISAIISDCKITSLLFIGCFRDNEVGKDHPLKKEVGNLAMAGVHISSIKLENIDRRGVNALVSDTLHLSPRITWTLSDIVYNKTSGNPLFAMQCLRSLYDDKLLHYSASSRRWEWDVEAIESKNIADNVVDLMMRKILKLDPEVQWLLKVAASLGSRCESSLLKLLGSDASSEELDVVFLLDICVREGLMCRVGPVYKFSHDQIHQAAYYLINDCEREALHLHIGRYLWKRTPEEELKQVIFVVVDQLQRGCALISDQDEKVEVARVFLAAGEKAMSSSAFSQASKYFMQGSVLLHESDWEDQYDLCLRLFSYCAEVQYAIGDYDGLAITANHIFAYGRCLQDKLWAIGNHLRSIGGQGKFLDALSYGLIVLAQLGEPFPSDVNEETFKLDFAKTQEMLGGNTIEETVMQERMADPKKVAAMKLLVILSRYAFQTNQFLCSMMAFRVVQLTVSHGICVESSCGFATLGATLVSVGDLEQGYRYGKLALSLLKTMDAKEYMAQVYGIVYTFINPFSEPLQAILPQLTRGYEVGMSTGGIEYGLICAAYSFLFGIFSGLKLDQLIDEGEKYVQQMKDYKQSMHTVILPGLQATLNLVGDSEDPIVLTGKVMNQEEFWKSADKKQHRNASHVVDLMRLWLACIFRRHDVAAEIAIRRRKMSKTEPLRAEFVVQQTLYTGLVAIEMARGGEVEGEGTEWRSIAFESLEKMKVWAKTSTWNFQHKLDLLNAEMAYLSGDKEEAANAYDDAIRVAGEHGFIHEQALACEAAGVFYTETCDGATGAEYFEKAHRCYLDWGAKQKADDLLERLGRK